MDLVWTPAFVRALKPVVRRDPGLGKKIHRVLDLLSADPFQPALRTHKLSGDLEGSWACSVAYDLRIVFAFVRRPGTGAEEILLQAVGSHDDVY
jgi:mRNA interferase YafQ